MKTGKRIVAIFLVVLMLLTAAPLTGFVGLEIAPKAKALVGSGRCGENVYWSFDEFTGALTISVMGKMYNFMGGIYSSPFHSDMQIKSLMISGGVTSIGDRAFYNCYSLTSVVIPDSVTSIGFYAFYNCYSLPSVDIPNSVTSIGFSAFGKCRGLTSIDIPNGVTNIDDGTFGECSRLTSVTIPDGVTSIGEHAFASCESLTSVDIPNSVTSIGDYAFEDCKSLTSVVIPNSVTSIGEYAFVSCESLTSVDIPNSVTSIGVAAFENCSNLMSVTIPDSVTNIGVGAFCGCTSLTSVMIPNSVTSIGGYAFEFCSSLTNVTISDSVLIIREKTFYRCSSLTSVTIPSGVTSIGEYAFYGCSSLPSITIPNSVTSIGDYAFELCSSLTSVIIPDSVTSIGKTAFYGCSCLTSITIPNSVTSIGVAALHNCADDLEIIGFADTCAQNYAEANGFIFCQIDSTPYVTLHTQPLSHETTFEAHGVANRYATISVCDGETLLGYATADASGRWSGSFALQRPFDPSNHVITAFITVNETTKTATDIVYFDSNAVYPVEFTLTHYCESLDLLKVRDVNLTVVPSLPMSFCVKLNRSVTSLKVVSKKNGEVKTLPMFYNAETGEWKADGWFDPDNHAYAPGEISLLVNDESFLTVKCAHVTYLIDPSGYVYEAVKSNRVEGASAFVYYKDGEFPVLWNANQYEQDNPQTTDAMGVYHWDVTEGQWRVKVVKGGYEPAYSDWMEVPPEWTEVAIPLITTTAPIVQSVEKSDDGYTITFSQYMNLDSINSKTVSFTENGSVVTGTLMPLNAEVSGMDESVEYASEFRFIPSVEPQGQLDVTITNTVNYASIAMSEAYTQENVNGKEHVHIYTPAIVVPAACTVDGLISWTCECGDSYKEVIPATGHNPQTPITEKEVEATCEGAGSYDEVVYCYGCGEELSRETVTVPALGHTDDNNDGHCDRCGEQMTGGDHCKFCGKIHNGGFFDKLTGFFHKIFAIFKR